MSTTNRLSRPLNLRTQLVDGIAHVPVADRSALFTLQSLVFPEPCICSEPALHFNLEGGALLQDELRVMPGGKVRTDTFMNLFSLEKWVSACDVPTLFLELEGRGGFTLRVIHAVTEAEGFCVAQLDLALEPAQPCRVDLSPLLRHQAGLIFLELETGDPEGAVITGGRFASNVTPDTLPHLAVSITTFRREAQLAQTVQRLEQFLATYEYADHMRVRVVDNGDSVQIGPDSAVDVLPNPNFGGASGFARGLIEAQDAGDTHCLFMDDDASFHMENIARSFAFLALARDPATAVAGAMITESDPTHMWEYGAVFDGSCRPMFSGTDLEDPGAVIEMELESAKSPPPTFYGGWWFFAFPVDHVTHHPFPFFVRGDDISFSLMNAFRIFTLNGVVSFQEDFGHKESPLTLYLDLRNHLVHHLVTESLSRNAMGTARVALFFMLRSMVRLHYGTARAQLLAWHDVMCGPEFFVTNIDMAERRAVIRDLAKTEFWHDPTGPLPTERRVIANWMPGLRRLLALCTLNGHLLPFSGRFFDRLDVSLIARPPAHTAFGVAEMRFANLDETKVYSVRQSKRQFFELLWDMIVTTARFAARFDRLKAQYRAEYPKMTSRAFWDKALGRR